MVKSNTGSTEDNKACCRTGFPSLRYFKAGEAEMFKILFVKTHLTLKDCSGACEVKEVRRHAKFYLANLREEKTAKPLPLACLRQTGVFEKTFLKRYCQRP